MDKLNGIYIEYHDTLRMDAFKAWAYKDGVNILDTDHELLKALTNNSEYQLRDALKEIKSYNGYRIILFDSSPYYNTIGLRDSIKIIKDKYPDLDVYAFDIGWYTFPSEWKPAPEWMRKEFTMIQGKAEDYFKQFNSNN